jgi:hypothetical protein
VTAASIAGVGGRIGAEVGGWPGIASGPHRFGGVEFKLGRREIGHLHGDRIADIPFPRPIRDRLIAEGRVEPHHVLPDSGWITFRIREPADAERAIELFRLSYERARDAAQRRGA